MIESSSIFQSGIKGSVGPIGPTGATGNTGATAINCASLAVGPSAEYIHSVVQQNSPFENYGNFIVTYDTNKTQNFLGLELIGNTLFDAYGITLTSIPNLSMVKNFDITGTISSGSTANLTFQKFASTYAGLTVSSDSNFLYIDGQSSIYSNSGFVKNSPTWFRTQSTLDSTDTFLGFTSNAYSETYLDFNRSSSTPVNTTTLLTKTNIKIIEPQVQNSAGSTLDISEAGVFYVNTPNGIKGFTGMSGMTGEIQSITLILENDNIWHFPENVWFRPNEAKLTCGENILNLTTQNNGVTWIANFFGKGYGAIPTPSGCLPSHLFGSCYTVNGNSCEDYITKGKCTSLNGIFCPNSLCCLDNQLDDLGSCCVNGICRDNVSKFLCEKYGGRHWTNDQTQSGGCSVIDCWDPCTSPPSSCCDGTTCHNNYTKAECDFIEGAFAEFGCSTTINLCHPLATRPGACCVGGDCIPNKTYIQCVYDMKGIFLGIDEVCDNINCDCFEQNTLCTNEFNENGEGRCLQTYDVFLTGLEILTNTDGKKYVEFCMNVNAYTLKDRFMLIASKGENPAQTTLFRDNISTSFYGVCSVPTDSDYINALTNGILPIRFGGGQSSVCVITDTDCVSNTQSTYVQITEDQVELNDNTDPWYKKIRLFVFGGCSGTQVADNTRWEVNFNCNISSCSVGDTQDALMNKEITIYDTNLTTPSVIIIRDTINTFKGLNIPI